MRLHHHHTERGSIVIHAHDEKYHGHVVSVDVMGEEAGQSWFDDGGHEVCDGLTCDLYQLVRKIERGD